MDKKTLRQQLIEERLNLPDRLERADMLQRVMRIWLFNRPDTVIGAYWPIKGEFDPLPVLHRWKEDGELLDQPQPRRIGLPVVDKVHKTMIFHAWYPGCPMEEDAYGIPKPKDTEIITPTLLFVACVGYAAGGYRLWVPTDRGPLDLVVAPPAAGGNNDVPAPGRWRATAQATAAHSSAFNPMAPANRSSADVAAFRGRSFHAKVLGQQTCAGDVIGVGMRF